MEIEITCLLKRNILVTSFCILKTEMQDIAQSYFLRDGKMEKIKAGRSQ